MNQFFMLKSDQLPHITYIGYNDIPEHWKHFSRCTDEYILYFITSGTMYLQEGKTRYQLSAGDAILLEPHIKHSGYKEDGCCYFYVHFSHFPLREIVKESETQSLHSARKISRLTYGESFLSTALYEEVALKVPKFIHIISKSDIYQITILLNEAIRQSNAKRLYYKTGSSCKLMEVFQIISSIWIVSIASSADKHFSPELNEKLNGLIDYLHNSYSGKITSRELETHFVMNFDYLNRMFKRKTGTTIFSYLNQIRLEQAKQLLAATTLPQQEIAARTGFSDGYYFSRFFKKKTGISPSHYRKIIYIESPIESRS